MNLPEIDVLTSNTMEDFVHKLNKRVAQGWMPQGSPFMFGGRVNIMLLKIPDEELAARV